MLTNTEILRINKAYRKLEDVLDEIANGDALIHLLPDLEIALDAFDDLIYEYNDLKDDYQEMEERLEDSRLW